MAFYSASIDDDGHETRRTFTSRTYSGRVTPAVMLSDGFSSARHSESGITALKPYKTVRCLNPAVFISEASESDPIDTSKSNLSHSATAEQGNELVPNLELSSNESFPSSDDMCYSYRKACEVSKIIEKPDAFKAWLSAKKKTKSYEMQKKKSEEEEIKRKREEKQREAKEKYNEWLQRKSQTKLQEAEKQPIKSEVPSMPNVVKAPSKEDFDRNFQAWLKRKMEKDQELKQKLMKNLEMRKQMEEDRRAAASQLYEKWLKGAANRPKPVPLNRGMLTLKGTVSDIFVNPDPWRMDPNVECEQMAEY